MTHSKPVVRTLGLPLREARAAMIMLHGRGATAESILTLADAIHAPGFAYLAPQAPGGTWYPFSFLAPLDRNEPALSAALATVGALVDSVTAAGLGPERAFLLGFSQGACLALEYAARHARRYGGLVGLSGGLIGPEGTPRDYGGTLDGTPVFLGCSEVDPHVPAERVRETVRVLERLGGRVTMRLYPGTAHAVNEDEIGAVRGLLASPA
ncbi:MAG TPA: alpha/beta hydrolase [Gemmatimonadales bacterium]|nr:alpha/beta hydrolase [Gemmatimonadales bacterium]